MSFSILFLSSALLGADPAWVKPDLLPMKRESATITEAYIPTGFDDNDLSQIVLEVQFKSTGVSVGDVLKKVVIEKDRHEIYLEVIALRYKDVGLQTLNETTVVVDLKVLPAGEYKVFAAEGLEPGQNPNQPMPFFQKNPRFTAKQIGVLNIAEVPEEMKSKRDNDPYAPVNSLTLLKDAAGAPVLVLFGAFRNNCLVFDGNPRLDHKAANVIEVRPVIKKEIRENCQDGWFPFMQKTSLKSLNLEPGKELIHVRTMDGGSFNKFEYFGDVAP